MTTQPLHPMGLGEVLDSAFQLLRQHFGTLVLTALVGFAPLLLLHAAVGVPYGNLQTEVTSVILVLFIAMVLAMVVVWAALARQVDRAATEGEVALGDGLRHGVRALPRILGSVIGMYLVLFALMIPAILVVVVAALVATPVLGESGGAVIGGVATAVMMVIMFGVWASLAFLLLPVLVSEGKGPIAAIRRANQLAKGGRVRVAVTAFVAFAISYLPVFGAAVLFGFGAALLAPEAAGTMSSTQMLVYQAVVFFSGVLTTPFLVAVMVQAYYDRRVRRDGYDVELASAAIPVEA